MEIPIETSNLVVEAKKLEQENKSAFPPITEIQVEVKERKEVEITLKSLLDAGSHYGHQKNRWNPKMAPYIFTTRNNVHIIDLPKTVQMWKTARQAIVDNIAAGGQILFVGTKKQARDIVIEEATRCNAYYVVERWLGGTMTNLKTVRKSVEKIGTLEKILKEEQEKMDRGEPLKYKKKERLVMHREHAKLMKSLSGVRKMFDFPTMLYIVDIKNEMIALKEAERLGIPVVAPIDTNCDPDMPTYPVPCNDDGIRSIALLTQAVADAVIEGNKLYAERKMFEKQDREEKREESNKATSAASLEAEMDKKAEDVVVVKKSRKKDKEV